MPTFKKPFQALEQDEQDDMLVQTLIAQERDLFAFSVNAERFTELLKILPSDCSLAKKLKKQLPQTLERINEVEAIILSLEQQLPSKERIEKAKVRLKEKEKQALANN